MCHVQHLQNYILLHIRCQHWILLSQPIQTRLPSSRSNYICVSSLQCHGTRIAAQHSNYPRWKPGDRWNNSSHGHLFIWYNYLAHILFSASRYVVRADDFLLIRNGTRYDQFIPEVSIIYREWSVLQSILLRTRRVRTFDTSIYKWSVPSHNVLQSQITVIGVHDKSSLTSVSFVA